MTASSTHDSSRIASELAKLTDSFLERTKLTKADQRSAPAAATEQNKSSVSPQKTPKAMGKSPTKVFEITPCHAYNPENKFSPFPDLCDFSH